jgi:hypothetical protein
MATKKTRVNSAAADAARIAEECATWAIENNVTDDPYLFGLIEGIEKRKNISMWASIDPLQYLPHPESDAGAKYLLRGRFVAIFRNILVYFPVALTWKAVSEATKAFAKFVELNGATTVNFLEFWQNGYKVLSSTWTIANVAQLDFLIILIVIALSFLASYMHERGVSLRNADNELIENERIRLGLHIMEYLHDKKSVTSGNISARLASSVQNLIASSNSLSETTKRIETTNKKVFSTTGIKKDLARLVLTQRALENRRQEEDEH